MRFLIPILFLLLCIPAVLPLLQQGFFEMHDDTQVARVYVMAKALKDGMFPVRFVEDLGYGYGYMIFNFYAPLPYYIGGFISLLLTNALVATKTLFILVVIVSGLTMFFGFRRFFGDIPSLVASIVYVYFPYHGVNTYVRGNLSELSAYVFLPLVFSSLYQLYYSREKAVMKRYHHILLLGLSLTGVILSHNLSAYMTLLFVALITGMGVVTAKLKKVFFSSVSFGIIVAVLLSAFYWLPVVFESKYTDVSSQVGGGSDFRDHFVCLTQFWETNWGYTGSVPGCLDGMSFTLGKTTILFLPFLLISLLYFYKKKMHEYRFLILTGIVCFVTALVLATEGSRLFWEVIPGMAYLQFPWRFLNYVSLFYAVLVGSVFFCYQRILPKKILIVLIGLFVFLIIGYQTRFFIPQELFERDADFYTNRSSIGYEVSKRSDEYLPAGFVIPGDPSEIPSQTVSGNGIMIEEVVSKTGYYEVRIKATESAVATASLAYFPAWQVMIDGKEETVTPISQGFSFIVPEGKHTVQVFFRQTPIEVLGNLISLIGIITITIGIIAKGKYGRAEKTT